MLERLRAHLRDSALLSPQDRVVVGLSGGADSVCLVHLLHRAGIDLAAAHLHHGQRSEADEELDKCQAYAEQLGIDFIAGRADVPRMSEELGIGIEEAGRRARYSFFRQALHQASANLVATAHTQDDHVETVLLNLTRGTGTAGLAGIPERRDGIIRPMLPFTRAEARAYCAEQGLWFHDDPGNEDLSFSRVRMRLRVIPELEKINPEVRQSIARLADIAGKEDRFLNGMAAAALEQAEEPLNGPLRFLTLDSEARFRADHLRALPDALMRRSIRLAVAALGSTLTYHQTDLIAEGLAERGSGSITTEEDSVHISWTEDRLDTALAQSVEPFRSSLVVPGETESPVFGWVITVHPDTAPATWPSEPGLEAWVDGSKLKGDLHLRTAQTGDRMQPLGMEGSRLLSDILGEMKLTRLARRQLPIICDLIGPVWIPGGPIAQRVRLDGESNQAVRLAFGPISTENGHNGAER